MSHCKGARRGALESVPDNRLRSGKSLREMLSQRRGDCFELLSNRARSASLVGADLLIEQLRFGLQLLDRCVEFFGLHGLELHQLRAARRLGPRLAFEARSERLD